MGYNPENYRKIREEYESKPQRARDAAKRRADELHERFETVAQIDRVLAETGPRILGEALKGREGLDDRIARLRAENEELRKMRAQILEANGYPADYSSVKYECPKCSDTGYVGVEMCDCLKKRLILAGYESSGIGKLIATQSFETFDLEKCRGSERQYENMKKILSVCRSYADNFEAGNGRNLLFMGTTGLGKTHLSTSIAKVVIERGYDVVYDTFQNILNDFEQERFGRSTEPSERKRSYYSCDLLIIDDLGAELTNQFTISVLYNLINTRLNNSAPMIINTNLLVKEIRERYNDRVTSRLYGEFESYMFFGEDMRIKKNLS